MSRIFFSQHCNYYYTRYHDWLRKQQKTFRKCQANWLQAYLDSFLQWKQIPANLAKELVCEVFLKPKFHWEKQFTQTPATGAVRVKWHINFKSYPQIIVVKSTISHIMFQAPKSYILLLIWSTYCNGSF